MPLRKSKKIPVRDFPPSAKTTIDQGVLIATIGLFCISVVIIAIMVVFLGA